MRDVNLQGPTDNLVRMMIGLSKEIADDLVDCRFDVKRWETAAWMFQWCSEQGGMGGPNVTLTVDTESQLVTFSWTSDEVEGRWVKITIQCHKDDRPVAMALWDHGAERDRSFTSHLYQGTLK